MEIVIIRITLAKIIAIFIARMHIVMIPINKDSNIHAQDPIRSRSRLPSQLSSRPLSDTPNSTLAKSKSPIVFLLETLIVPLF